jgi:hypothetical protein
LKKKRIPFHTCIIVTINLWLNIFKKSMASNTGKRGWTPLVLGVASSDVWAKIKRDYLSEDGLHCIKFRAYPTATGKVTVMKCQGFRRYKCPYQIRVDENSASQTCSILEGDGPHDHSTEQEEIGGLPQHQKVKVQSGLKSGKRPRKIYNELVLESPDTASNLKQVQGACNRMRRKILSDFPEDSVGFLREFLLSNQLTHESDQHDVGILNGWEVCCSSGGDHGTETATEVNFTITTKALLARGKKQAEGQLCSFVDTDGTYNLLANGYPNLLVGTVDAEHHFHLLGIAVSIREDHVAFEKVI